jgi:hypothetical protein
MPATPGAKRQALAAQIPDFFASELGEVLDVVARDVVFEVATGPGVRVTVLNPVPVEHEGHVTRLRLGDFVAEQEVTLLLAVELLRGRKGSPHPCSVV